MAYFFSKSNKQSGTSGRNFTSSDSKGVGLEELDQKDFPYDKSLLGIDHGAAEPSVQMKSKEEEEPVQQKKEEEEEPLQAKMEEEEKAVQQKNEEEEEPIQQKKYEEEEPLQAKFIGNAKQSEPENKGQADKMPASIQAQMESSFGTSFSDVSIHTNSSEAKQMGALAYTKGSDVHFAPGQFDPSSLKGQELIGHELAHVVQQKNGGVKPTVQKKGVAVNNDKSLEKEADDMGAKAARGEKAHVSSQAETSIQQKKDPGDEKYAQVWAVGPWDAYKAKQDAETALSAAKNSGLPGLHNGPADAYRHALWNFLMTQSIGEEQAKKVADTHEEYGSNPANEAKMDYHNNHKGRKAGAKGGDANAKIMGLLTSGELLVIPDYDTDAKLAPVPSNQVDIKGGKGKKGVGNYY